MKKTIVILILFVGLTSFTGIAQKTYEVDTKNSKIKWTGYHLAKSYEHWGNINIKSGTLSVNDGRIVSGSFVIDMHSITNSDLEDKAKNDKLVNHLKSDDFFAVNDHPEAKLAIRKTEKLGDNKYAATADITIRGITEEIEFEIILKEISDDKISAATDFNVVRTGFEVMYGWSLENVMLSDEFRLEVSVVAVP